MKIQVTAEDISNGFSSPLCCPVARACNRVLVERGMALQAWTFEAMLFPGQQIIRWPTVVKTFIISFDDGQPVEPFEFNLDLPAIQGEEVK